MSTLPSQKTTLIPTILCGGAGSRLWPVSRDLHPKPFIRLSDGQSLLQKAFLRGARLTGVSEVLTVTNRELFFKTQDDFVEVNQASLKTTYILEPFGRNTAAAITAAALLVEKDHGPDAVMLVLAADHLIVDEAAFEVAVNQAVGLAQLGKIVTFGIQPDAPETGYGYIEAEGNRVLRFVEKPDLEKATEYLSSGRFLWNSGMFCFRVDTLLQQMKYYRHDILVATRDCIGQSKRSGGQGLSQLLLDTGTFGEVPSDSIDFALIEKVAEAATSESESMIAVVPCSIGWSDIGSWTALSDLSPADDHGNRTEGEVLMHNSFDCTVRCEDRLVGVVGLRNLMIIDTPDALLVADKSSAQDVKHIYTALKRLGHETHRLHRKVTRPWGVYTLLEQGHGFKIKRIEVKAGARLSLQMHYHRSEHWVVVRGMAKVINGEKELFVNTNESTYISAGTKHCLENPGLVPLVMIEVQSGEYLDEDDIVRFDDLYGRA